MVTSKLWNKLILKQWRKVIPAHWNALCGWWLGNCWVLWDQGCTSGLVVQEWWETWICTLSIPCPRSSMWLQLIGSYLHSCRCSRWFSTFVFWFTLSKLQRICKLLVDFFVSTQIFSFCENPNFFLLLILFYWFI